MWVYLAQQVTAFGSTMKKVRVSSSAVGVPLNMQTVEENFTSLFCNHYLMILLWTNERSTLTCFTSLHIVHENLSMFMTLLKRTEYCFWACAMTCCASNKQLLTWPQKRKAIPRVRTRSSTVAYCERRRAILWEWLCCTVNIHGRFVALSMNLTAGISAVKSRSTLLEIK